MAVAVPQLQQLRFTATTAALGVASGLAKDASHLISRKQDPPLRPFVGLELNVQPRRCEVLDLADYAAGFRSLGVALVGFPSSLFPLVELGLFFQDPLGRTLHDRLVEVGFGAAGWSHNHQVEVGRR